MEDKKSRLLVHVRTARANLSVLHGLAEQSGNADLIEAVNVHHRALGAALKEACVEFGIAADDAEVAAESGGEDKPPQQGGPG